MLQALLLLMRTLPLLIFVQCFILHLYLGGSPKLCDRKKGPAALFYAFGLLKYLHHCVMLHKSKWDGIGVFYVILSRWLCPNHVNATASETKLALKMSLYHGEKRHGTGKGALLKMLKYHIILETLWNI